jgi:hypothetical protein
LTTSGKVVRGCFGVEKRGTFETLFGAGRVYTGGKSARVVHTQRHEAVNLPSGKRPVFPLAMCLP